MVLLRTGRLSGLAAGFVALTGAVAASSCQTEVVPPPPSDIGPVHPIGGGTNNPAPQDGGGSNGNECTTSSLGNPVTEYYQAEAPPGSTGGTIAPGTYGLTQALFFTGTQGQAGPSGMTYEATLTFNDNTYTDLELAESGDAGAETTSSTAGTFTVTGSTLTFTATCGSTSALSYPYSVLGSTLNIFVTSTEEFVFTAQ